MKRIPGTVRGENSVIKEGKKRLRVSAARWVTRLGTSEPIADPIGLSRH